MIRSGAFAFVLVLAGAARAASVDVPVVSSATSPEPGIVCHARITVDPVGTDVMRMQCDGLQPGVIYTVFLGIVLFSIGEMLTGPKKTEYFALIAPPGKKAAKAKP